LGEPGDKVKEVGPDTARRATGIFEFRASQQTILPLADRTEVALNAHRYVTRLHGG
jgi:hypothetical protein